ncbi:hypothetical protein BHM03_00040912, partial [Ensete ventricosum]
RPPSPPSSLLLYEGRSCLPVSPNFTWQTLTRRPAVRRNAPVSGATDLSRRSPVRDLPSRYSSGLEGNYPVLTQEFCYDGYRFKRSHRISSFMCSVWQTSLSSVCLQFRPVPPVPSGTYRSVRLPVRGSSVTGRFRQKSVVDYGRQRLIEEEIDRRRSIEREIDRRRSIEEGKGKKKRKRRKKEEEKKEYLARVPSPPAGHSRAVVARGSPVPAPAFSPARGDRACPKCVELKLPQEGSTF